MNTFTFISSSERTDGSGFSLLEGMSTPDCACATAGTSNKSATGISDFTIRARIDHGYRGLDGYSRIIRAYPSNPRNPWSIPASVDNSFFNPHQSIQRTNVNRTVSFRERSHPIVG